MPTEDRKVMFTVPSNLYEVWHAAVQTTMIVPTDDSENATEFDARINNAANKDWILDAIIARLKREGYAYDPKSDETRVRISEQLRLFQTNNPRKSGESDSDYKDRYNVYSKAETARKSLIARQDEANKAAIGDKVMATLAMSGTMEEKIEAMKNAILFAESLQTAPIALKTRKSKNS